MKTIELEYPVISDGLQMNMLHMRRPIVSDMLCSDKRQGSDAQKEIALFANLCEVAPSVIESVDMKDYSKLQAAYQGFLS